MNQRLLSKTFIKQHDQSDCGVACLASILQFYGGRKSLESLREMSGTAKTGTTMLGIYQAAQKVGFEPEGLEAGIEYLKTKENPSILHVIIDERLQHYVVCYGWENNKFVIGDPGKGIIELTEAELEKIWQSKTMLELAATERIEKTGDVKSDKRRWFVELIRMDANILSIIFALTLTISILGLVMAIFSQKLIDDILPNKNTDKLIIGMVLVTMLLFIKSGLSYITGFFAVRQGRDFNNRLIDKFYNNLLFLPKSFFDNRRIGELVARLDDTSQIQRTIATVVSGLLKDVLLFIVGEVILFMYSVPLGLFSLIAIPIFIGISYKFNKKVVDGQRAVMVGNAHKSSNYVNTMQGIDTIKADNKEKQFGDLNQKIYSFFQDKIFLLGRIGISLQFVAEFASVLIMIGLLSFGSYLVYIDTLTIGKLIAILSITGSIFPAFINLAFANITLQAARVAFERMYEFSAIRPEYVPNEIDITEKIDVETLELKNISFRFAGRKQILTDVNLTLKKGELVALFGESGSGKTTLLNILQRFYEPESGSILLNNINFYDFSIKDYRDKIGVVPQDVSLFNGSLVQNISLGDSIEEFEKCIQFCNEKGFGKYFDAFPQSYATLLGEEGINISGGQKQLVALARVLYKKPQLLLLDEPTSAMDRNTENFAIDLLNKIKDEISVIVVTHRVKIARRAEKIYILENGEINLNGDHHHLMKTDNLYSLSYKEII